MTLNSPLSSLAPHLPAHIDTVATLITTVTITVTETPALQQHCSFPAVTVCNKPSHTKPSRPHTTPPTPQRRKKPVFHSQLSRRSLGVWLAGACGACVRVTRTGRDWTGLSAAAGALLLRYRRERLRWDVDVVWMWMMDDVDGFGLVLGAAWCCLVLGGAAWCWVVGGGCWVVLGGAGAGAAGEGCLMMLLHFTASLPSAPRNSSHLFYWFHLALFPVRTPPSATTQRTSDPADGRTRQPT